MLGAQLVRCLLSWVDVSTDLCVKVVALLLSIVLTNVSKYENDGNSCFANLPKEVATT